MDLDYSRAPRFMVEPRTDDPFYAFRVKDLKTGETFGSGMLLLHAVELAATHDIWVQRIDA